MSTNHLDMPLDHVGIAVRDLDHSTALYQKLLGTVAIHDEVVESQFVKVRFLQLGEHLIELLQPLSENSSVSRFLKKRGEGLHHLAFRTNDILTEMDRLREIGMHLLQEEPLYGANHKLIFFIHPRSMDGVLVEVCQPLPT